MSFINYSSREINCKIVYYGPGLCGKTTNLQWIYKKTNPDSKGKMISLATETERTLFSRSPLARSAASKPGSISTPYPARYSTTRAGN